LCDNAYSSDMRPSGGLAGGLAYLGQVRNTITQMGLDWGKLQPVNVKNKEQKDKPTEYTIAGQLPSKAKVTVRNDKGIDLSNMKQYVYVAIWADRDINPDRKPEALPVLSEKEFKDILKAKGLWRERGTDRYSGPIRKMALAEAKALMKLLGIDFYRLKPGPMRPTGYYRQPTLYMGRTSPVTNGYINIKNDSGIDLNDEKQIVYVRADFLYDPNRVPTSVRPITSVKETPVESSQ
jgi:hypothetical protein